MADRIKQLSGTEDAPKVVIAPVPDPYLGPEEDAS
jgi:hypothetical protein